MTNLVINFDNKNKKWTHWVSLIIDINTALYLDSFRIEYIFLEVLNKIRDKSITHNILKIQDIEIWWYDNEIQDNPHIGFYCIPSREYMLVGKTLLDYFNLFSPNDYKKNDKIIYKYFKDNYGRRSKSWV